MKHLKIFSAICLVALLATISSCNKTENNYNGGGDPASTVAIQTMQFQPLTLTVAVGTKITWKNLDPEDHTVTSDDGISFNSGTIVSQGTFSFTPVEAGTYNYHCTLHPEMKAAIVAVTR